MVRPKAKRLGVGYLHGKYPISHRRASKVLGLGSSTAFYKPRTKNDEPIRKRISELIDIHRRFGLPRLHYLLKREGLVQNEKRTKRIYRAMGIQIQNRKRRTKQGAVVRMPRPKPVAPNEVWSFDFVSDRTESGRRLKILTVVDDFTKRCPGLLTEFSITSNRMIQFFDELGEKPKRLRCDNGPEMTSKDFLDWAYRNKIEIEYIQPGKPTQNAFIESFNSRIRTECLNEQVFMDLKDAKRKIGNWWSYYNERRPHTSIGMKTPMEFEQELMQVD
ncbi:MAG: transposase [Oligoflexia bacterium]|nr:MAG: transposase [Oligoflexia bacterium]